MTKQYDAEALLASARDAMSRAYAPYSDFHVGAALLTADEVVVQGTNVENASFGLTMCAERSAIFTAVTNGQREFKAIAIVASGKAPHTPKGELSCTPCGACRQVLSEFGDSIVVILERDDGSPWEMALSELLPYQFVLKVD